MSNNDINKQLELLNKNENAINTGKRVNEDAWMTRWVSCSWGDLLQPAPLSISLLGSLLIIASSTDDFSLNQSRPKDVPAFQWRYVQWPDSFKSSLMQMVNAGYTSYRTAQTAMEEIEARAGSMEPNIKTLVQLLLNNDPLAIKGLFNIYLDSLKKAAEDCKASADKCQKGFQGMADLAAELVLGCTYQAGNLEQVKAQNEINIAILEINKTNSETQVKATQKSLEVMTTAYVDAQSQFKDAVKSMPTGWDLVGMGVVESLTSLAVSAGNALITQATMSSQLAMQGANILSGKVSPKDPPAELTPTMTSTPTTPPTVPSLQTSTDPGASRVRLILNNADAIKLLLTGDEGGKPDWEKIGSKNAKEPTGGNFVLASLENENQYLQAGQPISDKLIPIVNELVTLLKELIAASTDADGDAFAARMVPKVNATISDLQAISQTSIMTTQGQGSLSTGIVTPPPAKVSEGKNGEIAVEGAKFRIDQTKQVLEGARDAYEKANDRLADQQSKLAETIAEMTKIDLATTKLRDIIPVLKQAVGSFNQLQAQIAQLVSFFDGIATMINSVMVPSVADLVKVLQTAEIFVLGGLELKDFMRNLVYQQTKVPLQVSQLAMMVAGVYVEVSKKHIIPAQAKVGQMLKFSDDSGLSKDALLNTLRRSQEELSTESEASSEAIVALVNSKSSTFLNDINERIDFIDQTMSGVLPDTPPAPVLVEVKDEYVKGVDKQGKKTAAQNPMNKSLAELELM